MVPFIDEHRDRWPVAVMCRTIGFCGADLLRGEGPAAVGPVDQRRAGTRSRSVGCGTRTTRCYGPRRIYKQLRTRGPRDRPLHRRPADAPTSGSGACSEARKQFTTIPDDDRRPAAGSRRPPVRRRRDRTSCGSPTSPTCRPGRAGSTSRSSSTCTRRMIVGWQIANHLRTDLVLDALEMAVWRRDLTDGDLRPSLRRRLSVHELPLHRPARRGRTSPRRSAPSATATTTRWPKRSTARSKPSSIKLHGPWRTRDASSRSRSSNGSTGTTRCRLHSEIGDIPPAEHEADWYRHNPAATAALTT